MNTQEFGELGLEYYICGRYSFFCDFSITGNLFHHAVEMFLKMALCQSFTEAQLRKKFGHKLKLLWAEFKKINPAVSLIKHDKTIDDLDTWEEIRYPSQDYRLLSLRLDRKVPIPTKHKGPKPKHYKIILEELDELVADIFQTASISPKIFKRIFLGTAIVPEAKRFYYFENSHPLKFD